MNNIKTIHILPDFIANQIAAGEVVQRPESVIKELVENSIDSGASTVSVFIKGAGKQLIHVVDDGKGMTRDDLELSIKRHATSKITTQEDLESILTFGFRGEALASIASVSMLEIRTRNAQEDSAWRLVSEPGKEIRIEPFALDSGTQIIVKNIFYNVPARRKFLRANLTEFKYISETMTRFALSNPNLRFVFYDNDSLIFDVHPESLQSRITNVLPNIDSSLLMPVEQKSEYLKISGFVGNPNLARLSRASQFLFLNGRTIHNRALSHAVYASFEHLIEKKQHPMYLLNIELDPKKVDINIHPQKHEVKFEDERYVYNMIRTAVNECLQTNNLTYDFNSINTVSSSPFERIPGDAEKYVNRTTGEVFEPRERSNREFDFDFPKNIESYPDRTLKESFERSAFDELFGDHIQKSSEQDVASFETPINMYWQLHKKYITVQTENGMLIVDQHNAHERILYERAIRAMNKEYRNSQQLMFPIKLKVTSGQLALIKELESNLIHLGYSFNVIGDNDIEIFAVPIETDYGSEDFSMLDIVDQYDEYQKLGHSSQRDNLAASFSCKAAIKTGRKLAVNEMKALVDNLFSCAMPYVCPHGRPVILEYRLSELDKKFGRT